MKISRFNLNILKEEIKKMLEELDPLGEAIEAWSNPIYSDADWISMKRHNLEKELTEFRERMALIYDFMGDRGLADFIPTAIRNANEEAREPWPEEPTEAIEEIAGIIDGNGVTPHHTGTEVPRTVITPTVDEVVQMIQQREYDDG